MRMCVTLLFCLCFAACAKVDSIESRIDLGALGRFKMANVSEDSKIEINKNKKPAKEIARICHSFFGSESYKSYNILSIENLLIEAKKNTGLSSFSNVGIYLKEINILSIWQRRCLILGEE